MGEYTTNFNSKQICRVCMENVNSNYISLFDETYNPLKYIKIMSLAPVEVISQHI